MCTSTWEYSKSMPLHGTVNCLYCSKGKMLNDALQSQSYDALRTQNIPSSAEQQQWSMLLHWICFKFPTESYLANVFSFWGAQVVSWGQTTYTRILDYKPLINTYNCKIHRLELKYFLRAHLLHHVHQAADEPQKHEKWDLELGLKFETDLKIKSVVVSQ